MESMPTEGDDGLPVSSMKEMKNNIVVALDEMCLLAAKSVTIGGNPKLHEDSGADNLKKMKLHVQSEIEATMQEDLLELPDDESSLLKLAKEEAETMEANNARTLEAYQEKVLQLEEEKKYYDSLVSKATKVDEQLDKIIATQSKEETLALLNKRHNNTGEIFKVVRSELQYILSELYPEQRDELSLEDLLEKFILKLLNDPADPYITIDEEVSRSYITFLLRANLVRKHKQDPLKFRFIDPRD